jgi:hypothetical protein
MKRLLLYILLSLWFPIFAQAANDFSGDANCIALYRFENNPLHDYQGSNSLAIGGEPDIDAVDFKEGVSSADFESENNDRLAQYNVWLQTGFPGKSGDTNKKLSVCCWFKLESVAGAYAPDYGYRSICGIIKQALYSWGVAISNSTGTNYARFRLGYNNGDSVEEITNTNRTISTGVWYHLLVSYQNSDKSYRVRVYDTSNSTAYSATGNTTNNINVEAGVFEVGSAENQSVGEFDGRLDELVIFNDIVTTDEQDQIIAGTYDAGGAPAVGGGATVYMGNF